jgi:cysteine desulfurase
MKLPVYLDHAATTPVDKRVAAAMSECLTRDGNFANPASRGHIFGWRAEDAVETARQEIAACFGADPREIVFTSGATESNNLALKGFMENLEPGAHLITSLVEHKSVLDNAINLESRGYRVSYLEPSEDGSVDPDSVRSALTADTRLVSLMHVNNETGAINDIDAIAGICRENNIAFHVDAAQSAGKLPIDLQRTAVDLMSFSAHKIYGPKGVGALFIRRREGLTIQPQMLGGGHERGFRSGTLATHQIAGMAKAFVLACETRAEDQQRIASLRQALLSGLRTVEEIQLHGSESKGLPGIVNVTFRHLDGETLLMALKDIAVSTGSACTSATIEPSYVLTAMGVSADDAQSAIRFSLGRETTAEEIDFVVTHVCDVVQRLRELSPEWRQHQAS